MNFSSSQEVKKIFEEVYIDIFKTRFSGLPVVNNVLSVKVIGLRDTEDFYTFSLITPWMLNKIAVPKKGDVKVRSIAGMRVDQLERLGEFYIANVISPMDRFKSMERAIRKAERLAEELFAEISKENNGQHHDISRDFFPKN
ncbi:MAG: [NiFe]-hydrogenase assembly chaperone HybE [bacterium]